MKHSIAIVGCGKVGTSMGIYLAEAGYKLAGFASKSLLSARRAAGIIATDNFSDVPWEITKDADIIFLTTPDSAIEDTCNSISSHSGFRKDAVVFHCSGVLPSTILSSAKDCGAFTGSMHPLQTFAPAELKHNPFQGIVISVEGDDRAVFVAKEIAADLGAESFTINTDAKTLYHASAVVASNYLVTLLDMSFRLIGTAGISDRDAFKVLKPLIENTLSNIEQVGISKALTGPIVRGDAETVEKHIEEIGSKIPDMLDLYKILGCHTVDIATTGNVLSKEDAKKLKNILID
jgi:predicted short-subunit dehydrogenase-like oxidoreductase (DUF2520 family)